MMLRNHEWTKDPFRVQDRSVDFSVKSVKSLLTWFQFPHNLSSFGVVPKMIATILWDKPILIRFSLWKKGSPFPNYI